MRDILALIPARGGSKRIPRKNMKQFLGKEIISYPIEQLRQVSRINTIYVSTDCPDIQNYTRSLGAESPVLRSKESSDDFATTFDVVREVLHALESLPKYCLCVYPTSVFVTSNMIDEACDMLLAEPEATSVCTLLKYDHPIQRALHLVADYAVPLTPEYYNSRTQDLELAYHDAGQFYLFETKAVLNEGRLITSMCLPLILEPGYAHDIDTESDWLEAEAKYRRSHRYG